MYKLYEFIRMFLNRLTDEINRVFESMLFSQFIGSLSIICLAAFEATVLLSDKLACMKFIVYLFAAFIQLFFWCFFGNNIYYEVKLNHMEHLYRKHCHLHEHELKPARTFQSTAISDAAFNCKWYDMDRTFKRTLQHIIMRSHKPIYFRGGSFYVLNFETFISVSIQASGLAQNRECASFHFIFPGAQWRVLIFCITTDTHNY